MALTAGYMIAEVVGGLIANSLALLADAGHMVTDVTALGLALLAMWLAARQATIKRTFGFYRAEVLVALVNAVSLWLIAAWVLVEAYRRFQNPPEVQGFLMLGVGVGGLLVNLVSAWLLHRPSHGSLNAEAALLHVMGDLLGSVAVVGAGLLVLIFGWYIADPIIGAVIGIIILVSSARLLWKVLHVLMEGTPQHLDLHRLCQRLERVEGVSGVHDIHAWSITTGYDALSVHVTANPVAGQDRENLLRRLREIASQEFGIAHVTIQLEESQAGCAEDHHIRHPGQPPSPSQGQQGGG